MNWNDIYSHKRSETDPEHDKGPRSEYQIDFDRLIFSSGFRRLQNKTQVFPLPGNTFVHNRLTHSLEVASVGRSLGTIVGSAIADEHDLTKDAEHFYRYELSNVIAAACLAHDIGNPAFGHSGEKAISHYFIEAAEQLIEGRELKSYFDEAQWKDISNFEGNANAFRILTHQFKGKSEGGLKLTYSTLAAILKYPCESVAMNKHDIHRKKYGFFQTEKETFRTISKSVGMIEDAANPIAFKRHPFVYLTEAADDICYRVIDMEDAQRLGILPASKVEEYFLDLIANFGNVENTKARLNDLQDKNERIGYLRAKSINVLINQAVRLFTENMDAISNGTYNNGLIDQLQRESTALQNIQKMSVDAIYNHETVMEIEIAGYNVMSNLLGLMVPALLKSNPNHKDQKVIRLIPRQFMPPENATPYRKVMAVLDYVSGMTDGYATDLYRKAFGIEIPKHQ